MATICADKPASAPPGKPARKRSRLWPIVHGCGAGFLVVVLYILLRDTLGGNFHTVIAGRIFRSAQPTGPELEQIIHDKDIRTVVNLRGCCTPLDWYLEECRVTHRLNVAQEDISLSATRMPSTSEIRRLVEVLDHCEYPILFHCFHGADRTGLASAVALLLQTDASLDEAQGQLGINYGHIRIGKTAYIDRFFELYSDWLAERGLQHSPEVFRRWAVAEYCPGACRCKLVWVHTPGSAVCGKPILLAVRATNTSIEPWHFSPASNAGIHAGFTIYDERNQQVAEGRAGLFEADVAPGESIDLTIVLPPIAQPGRYQLNVDLVDEQHCSFFQAGSDLLEWELEVREQSPATGG